MEMPREALIPPPEPPVVVPDDRFTIKAPTSDRDELCKALIYLSKKVFDALEDDCSKNKRYARRLRIINYKHSVLKRMLVGEELLVEMPYEASCWNDLEHDYVKVCIMSRVQKEEHSHLWYKLTLEFDQFMSEQTKHLMDQMDEDYDTPLMIPSDVKVSSDTTSPAATPRLEPTSQSKSSDISTPEVTLSHLRQRQTVQTYTPAQNALLLNHRETAQVSSFSNNTQHRSSPTAPKFTLPENLHTDVDLVGVKDEDDDDDDMPVVVYECVQSKKVLIPDKSVR